MPLKLSNRARSVLAANIAADTTSFAIRSGDEGLFPSLVEGDWFPVTVVDNAGNVEHMRCTARSGVTLTVIRAREGTTARSFDAGSNIDLRLTAGELVSALADATRLTDGIIDRSVLGPGFEEVAAEVGNLNTHAATGLYRAPAGATGAPTANVGFFFHFEGVDGAAYQLWRRSTTTAAQERLRVAGIWQAWAALRLTASDQDAAFLAKGGGTLTGKVTGKASEAVAGAMFNLPPGVTPDTPANGDIWATSAGVFARVAGVTVQLTNVAPSITIKESIMMTIARGENGDFRALLDSGYAGTIKRVVSRSASGTVTATVKINSTALGGTANSVSSTEQIREHSSANTFAVGDDVTVTLSANNNAMKIALNIEYERVVP